LLTNEYGIMKMNFIEISMDSWLRIIVAIIVIIFPAIFTTVAKLLKDDKDHIRLFVWLADVPWWDYYAGQVKRINEKLDNFFGIELLSWYSFNRCIIIALIYPFIALVISLLVTPDFDISRVHLIIGILPLVLFATGINFLLNKVDFKLSSLEFFKKNSVKSTIIETIIYILVGTCAFDIIILITASLGLEDHYVGSIIASGIITVAIVLSFKSNSVIKSIIICVAITVITLISFETFIDLNIINFGGGGFLGEGFGGAVMIILGPFILIFVLPVTNALLDWQSWAISRYLIRRLEIDAQNSNWLAMSIHFMLDIILAFIFLATLTAMFANIASFLGMLGDTNETSNILSSDIFLNAATDPAGKGLWLSIMLVSTLLPTLIHSSIALLAILFLPPPLRKYPTRYLAVDSPSILEGWMISGYISIWITIAISLVLTLLYIIMYLVNYHGTTYWDLIFQIANFLVV